MTNATTTENNIKGETYSAFIESDAGASSEELKRAMQENGYLFFRGLVPKDAVLRVRHDVLELCREAGWLNPQSDMMEGIVSHSREPMLGTEPEYIALYRKLLKVPSFHAFPTQASLIEVARKFLGYESADEVLVHPRRIGRVMFPNLISATTPPHQDHHYIRGAAETYSCWTPLGACPIELGGLAILPGSHRRGFIEHSVKHKNAVGGYGVPMEEPDIEWHLSDYDIGDTVFFHSYTIHKAMPNLTADRLRLSTDNRYQRSQDEIDPDSLRPHFNLN